MKVARRGFLHLAVGAGALAGGCSIATAQSYPSRPINLVVGFTPGAATDTIGRLFAQGAGPLIGQQFVVDNKPAAGSSIAALYDARADRDGYTLFVPALSALTNEIVNPTPSLDMSRDYAG